MYLHILWILDFKYILLLLLLLLYADDSQLYVDFSPCDEKTALANLQRCIQEVREWLKENFLLLNDKKIEVVIFGKDTTEKQLQIGKSVISSRSAATSLGCILDSKLNMSQHVSRVCKSANYYLHCIRKIRNFINMDACNNNNNNNNNNNMV